MGKYSGRWILVMVLITYCANGQGRMTSVHVGLETTTSELETTSYGDIRDHKAESLIFFEQQEHQSASDHVHRDSPDRDSHARLFDLNMTTTDDMTDYCFELLKDCAGVSPDRSHDTNMTTPDSLLIPDYCFELCRSTLPYLKIRNKPGLTLSQTFLALMIATGFPVAMTVLLFIGMVHLISDRVRWPTRTARHQPQRLMNEPSLTLLHV